jgi:hypothetical protein
MSCENCLKNLKDNEELYELDGDFLCYWCKEDQERWENNFLTYTGPKDTKFIVGKFYSYKLDTHDSTRGFETHYYECIKRTKHYIHFKDDYETVKKKPKVDIWGNEFVWINRCRLDADKFKN